MYIAKLTTTKVIKWIIYLSLCLNCFISEFGFSNSLFYLNDLLLALLVFTSIRNRRWNIFKRIDFSPFYLSLSILLCVILIGVIINFVPLRLILWGARNTFRGILFFAMCVMYLSEFDVWKIMDLFAAAQVLNFALGLYQFFVLGLKQDRLGGLFGHGNGNALCIFCVIVCSYSALRFLNTKKGLLWMVFCIVSSFILAALAEEKLLMIELIIVAIMCVALSRKSYSKLLIIPIAVIAFQQAIVLFDSIFPNASSSFLSLASVEKYMSASWLGSYYIPRLGAFSFISDRVFNHDLSKMLLGFGMGNCETSTFTFFQSELYQQYGYMNYRWIFSQWTIMETGILGLYAFVFLFLMIVLYYVRKRSICSDKERILVDTSIITTVISVATMWFNTTLKVDTAYLAYFAIAAGMTCLKSKMERYNEL